MEETTTPDEGGVDTSIEHAAQGMFGILDAENRPPENKDPENAEEPPKEETQDEGETVEPEETPETEEEEPEQAEETSEADAEIQLSTIDELAEATGLDIDKILNLKVQTVINGESTEATLSELKKGWQLEKSFTPKHQQFAEEKKAFEAEKTKAIEDIQLKHQATQQFFKGLHESLVKEHDSIDWKSLEETDPGAAALQKQKFHERYNEINDAYSQIDAEAEKIKATQQQQNQEAFNKELVFHKDKLLEAVPEWNDQAKCHADLKELSDYATSQGYSKEEVSNIYDCRDVLILRKAMAFDQQGKLKKSAEKKRTVKKLKVVKPGTPTDKQTAEKKARQDKIKQLRKTGSKDAFASLMYEDIMKEN